MAVTIISSHNNTASFRDADNYDDAYYCRACLQEILDGIPTD